MGSSKSNWEKFFKEAGIPSKPSVEYASVFCDNRMRLDMLEELNKEVLQELGVKAVGDIIVILRHAKTKQKELSRQRSPSPPEIEIVAKKPAKTTSLSMTVKTDSSKSDTTNNPTKSAMKQNRRSLSQRFNEYAKEAKLKKTQDEAVGQEDKTRELPTSNKNQIMNVKPLSESTSASASVAATVTSLRSKAAIKNPVFTIQLPSKQSSLKNITSSNTGVAPLVASGNKHQPSTSNKVSLKPKVVTVVPAVGRTLNRNKQSTSIFDRLDQKNLKRNTEDETDPDTITKPQGVFSRLGILEKEENVKEERAAKAAPKNVFSRLGDR